MEMEDRADAESVNSMDFGKNLIHCNHIPEDSHLNMQRTRPDPHHDTANSLIGKTRHGFEHYILIRTFMTPSEPEENRS